LTKEQARKLQD